MARIAGIDIPRDKRIVVALQYIYGIGNTTAKNILKAADVSEDIRTKDLTEEQEDVFVLKLLRLRLKEIFVVKLLLTLSV